MCVRFTCEKDIRVFALHSSKFQILCHRPLVHALVQPGLKMAVGLELDEIKCLKSESVIRESFAVARQLADEEGCVEPRVIHRDIEKASLQTARPCPPWNSHSKLYYTQWALCR